MPTSHYPFTPLDGAYSLSQPHYASYLNSPPFTHVSALPGTVWSSRSQVQVTLRLNNKSCNGRILQIPSRQIDQFGVQKKWLMIPLCDISSLYSSPRKLRQ